MAALNEKIVIVGAGCFGVSAAYHLLRRGFTDVTILDRASSLPAPDAASNDMNRIVRSAYSDIFYTKLAREAITAWKDREEWADTYHECGVVVLGFSGNESYADGAYENDKAFGANLKPLSGGDAIRAAFPPHVPTASFDEQSGYLNSDSGWANAGQGLALMISKVIALGAKVLTGKNVSDVVRDNGRTTGVRCQDGTVYDASLLVIATGSWTPSAFPELTPSYTAGLSTGQCVAMIQLTDYEVELYKDCPVVLDFSSGFYVFPPTDKGVIKAALHVAGYTHTNGSGISTPRTVTTDPKRGLFIPKSDLQQLRKHLRGVYPGLADKPFSATRLCWYNDTPDGNWMIGRVPGDSSLVVATGDSGHAYKFLPVIGRLVADVIQEKMEPSIAAKFAIERQYTEVDDSRRGMLVTELDLDQLCTLEDLVAT
ncbi:putative FAD dependent oxidoreductase [Lyophyllum shimeji]|uniref:FAD dependent oxidoreductase n=1 Tax=Lyophyllum shimeji TaxID=47721 RepID=A0A9P3UNY6_LYOSH|nr:putative FAD dependent oxidoreductase [Lyophyllum shimeji]